MPNKKPVIGFVPADKNNDHLYEMFINSLRKFHSEKELPIIRYEDNMNDPMYWYRATPIRALPLLDEYEYVIKFDADNIVLGDISHLWKFDADVGVVNNSNPRDFKAFPYTFLNIHPLAYVNCGLVVMKSKPFVEFWRNLCYSSFFDAFQMKEQDMLNFLVHSNNYSIFKFDEGPFFNGLASKRYTPSTILKEGSVVLPANASGDGWPNIDKILKLYHFAGGNDPVKGNYRTLFPPEVVKYIDTLVK